LENDLGRQQRGESMKAVIFIENFETLNQKHQGEFGVELSALMQKYGLFAKSVEAGHEHPAKQDGL